jgi:hypothetical protein
MALAIQDGSAARADVSVRHSAGGSVRRKSASDSPTWAGPIQAKARTAAPAGPAPSASIQGMDHLLGRRRTCPEPVQYWGDVGSASNAEQLAVLSEARQRLINGCPVTKVQELFG